MEDDSNAGVDEEVLGAGDDAGVEADDSLSSEESEGDTDWKTLYEQEKAEKENYKTALTQKRQLRKKEPEPVVEVEDVDLDDDDDSKPLTRGDLRQERALEKVDTILAATVTDPDKRKYIRLLYDTRIRQTGTSDDAIRADIDAALAIAEAPRLRKTAKELARVAQTDTVLPMSGNGSDRGAGKSPHKFSAEQVAELTATAKRINVDPSKFIEQAWKNQVGR